MRFVQCDSSGSPVQSAPPSLSCSWTKLTPPPTLQNLVTQSPAPSLCFYDSNIENIPSYHDCIGTNINGTLATEARFFFRAPMTAVRHCRGHVKHQLSRLNLAMFKRVLSGWAEEASFELSAFVNRAFEGHDACEMGYKVTDLIPSITLPTVCQLGRKFDSFSDILQALLERAPPETEFEDEGLQRMQWVFAVKMGEKVRHSLIEQGICKPWQIMPSRENLQWQDQLSQALVSVLEQLHPVPAADTDVQTQLYMFSQKEFSFTELMEFEPVWVVERDKKVWRLEIATPFIDLDVCNGGPVDKPNHLQTWFELPESAGSVSINDYCRSTRTVEEEWEMLL